MHIQDNLGYLMKKYGKEHHPPPWDSMTLSNEFGEANLHMVQKTFVGAFEVHIIISLYVSGTYQDSSSISFFHQNPRRHQ